jgi:outer membrane receptor protein involved in Fe transport
MYVNANFGEPYYAYLWDGYLKDNANNRFSVYAQDSWTVAPRLTINPGVRIDRITGFNKALDDQVFSTTAIAPRVGLAWDVRGNSRTVVRGHYGLYFDGAKSSYYDLLDPGIRPVYGVYVDGQLNFISDTYLHAPGTNRTMDPDIKHPRLIQGVVGVEHELTRGLSIGANGIYRKNDQFIDDVLQITPGDFRTFTLADPGPDGIAGTGDETAATLTAYTQLSDSLDNQYLITNPAGAFRKYQGVELTATRRMSNRWQLQGSWVISKITGNYDNTSNAGNSATEYNNPNTDPRFQPNREGRLTNDNMHIAKVLGSVKGPWDMMLSGAFYYTTGQAFARTVRTTRSQTPQGRQDLFIEPRGSQRYDNQKRLDLRLEKQFPFGPDRRLGVTLEGFNVLNDSAITSRTTRSGSSYFTPQGLVSPRRFRVGVVYRF